MFAMNRAISLHKLVRILWEKKSSNHFCSMEFEFSDYAFILQHVSVPEAFFCISKFFFIFYHIKVF